ncbi:MAG: BREX-1 system adenine-specific DNA-methyltransferase PglX [Atopobiaceae bacterium]|jgi:type II restriction/modification system DNA methylase subunit YeeA
MDDSAIRNYCTWARNELRDEVMRRCAIYGIAEKPAAPADADAIAGRVLTDEEKRQRRELLEEVGRNGLERTVERAAYTWFNRIAAIRFMEVNDRLPSRTRLLSANDGSFRPQALQEPLSVDIEGLDRAEVARLVQEGDDEATFRCLLLAQCHELAACMPGVFERVGAAMELLLPDGLLREGGVVERMVDGIPESDWTEGVEIVGWMYQYYNQERKDEYFASKRKATADDIAPATQLFTPEWIVRYLVENSLGRLWMLNFPESRLKDSMEYYIDPGDEHEEDFLRIGSPEDITFCDPCCGSGHILVYAFDLLARMYEEQGYSRREIPQLVLTKNLTGIEIDRRAGQLASFALTMKACEYDRRFLSRGVQPNVTVLESVRFGEGELAGTDLLAEGHDLLDAFAHLDEVGSLYVPAEGDLSLVEGAIEAKRDPADMFAAHALAELETMKAELELLSRHFSTVVTNPPYLGNFNPWMSKWVKDNYPDEKNDCFAAFVSRNITRTVFNGYSGLVTPSVWMFISSYEKLRRKLLETSHICSMVQLSYHGFPDVTVPTCTFVLMNGSAEQAASYVRLQDFDRPQWQAEKTLEAIHDHDCGWFYKMRQTDFSSIPGSPIAYWASRSLIDAFIRGSRLSELCDIRNGLSTSDNNRFLRLWFEVSHANIGFACRNNEETVGNGKRWYPHLKGGDFRKWYGNQSFVINWENDGEEIRNFRDNKGKLLSRPQNLQYNFKPAVTWSKITSGDFSARYCEGGFLYDSAAEFCFSQNFQTELSALAFENSSCCQAILNFLNPTLNIQAGDIGNLPIIQLPQRVLDIAEECIDISKQDWNSFETSWDFTKHPLISGGSSISEAAAEVESKWENRFIKLQKGESELNQIIAETYGVADSVATGVSRDKVSIKLFDRNREIRSLISYAVGCMMGRYSLDVGGLVLADQGATLDDYLEKVPEPTFMPDEDGIIPLTDVEYFHDDATGLFVDFLKAAYGEEPLEENLAFVAESLGGEGAPREVIRDYFRNGFFADHCKTYSVTGSGKRPIYWLFDSGKKGGFRALFYMHRYTPDLLARLRTDYVHPQQERYRNQIEHIDEVLPTADRREAARLKKERKRLSDQLAETNVYEEKVHHLADQMIRIDLDDGVKHNYALFQDVLAKIK